MALLGVTAGTAVGAAVLASSGLAALVAWGFGPIRTSRIRGPRVVLGPGPGGAGDRGGPGPARRAAA